MLKVSLKGLWAHKRRLLGTFIGVFVGIAFLSGTLVLGDTMRANFSTLFGDVFAGTDAVVRSSTKIEGDFFEQRGLLDESLVDTVKGVDGVAEAAANIDGRGAVVGKDGDVVGASGPPRMAGVWIDDPDLNPYRLVDGRAPETPDEVVVDRKIAKDGDFVVGDTASIMLPKPIDVTIVGIATFGKEDSAAGATFTAFTLEGAQQNITKEPGKITGIVAKAVEGVSQEELASRIDKVLPDGTEALTGEQLTEETTESINDDFLDFLTLGLTAFAGIALLVTTFSIYNTFSILVAQRTRESALLRAIGASRRQVLGSVMAESLLIGALASVAGLFAGVLVAGGLKALFDAAGFGLPAGGVEFKPSTVYWCMGVGIVVTFAAGVIPALKASRVPPLAAMRDVAVESTKASFTRVAIGAGLAAIGTIVVLQAVIGGGDYVMQRYILGALMMVVGIVVFGPIVSRTAAASIGTPVRRFRGVPGSLARENAMRNPRRTSATAAALLIGVAVVTLFTVFAASINKSINDTVSKSFVGDLVVNTGGFGEGGFSPELADEIAELPEVDTAAGLGRGLAQIGNDGESFVVADLSNLGNVLKLTVESGSLDTMTDQQIAVSNPTADDNNWQIGSSVPISFVDGSRTDFTIGAIYERNEVAGGYLMPRAAWAPHAVQDTDGEIIIRVKDGVDLDDAKAAINPLVDPYADGEVQTKPEYIDSVASGIQIMLFMIYVMLALAVLIALMGIANTLALSIHERTRELGLLRAVGETKGQMRSMVRWESVIISVFGTVGGIALGVFLGWALVEAASSGEDGIGAFAAPPGQLITVLIVGAIAGILAGWRPARKAAKLDVLQAIAAE